MQQLITSQVLKIIKAYKKQEQKKKEELLKCKLMIGEMESIFNGFSSTHITTMPGSKL